LQRLVVWAISDLHLSFFRDKPMSVFGARWKNHAAKIEAAWRAKVSQGDIVCLPGDFSWAMRLNEAAAELDWLAALPGRKVLVKGNHDYWWGSVGKIRASAPEGIYFIQNDSISIDGVAFAGARGWFDHKLDFSPFIESLGGDGGGCELVLEARDRDEDEKIFKRELSRLETSLRQMDSNAKLRIAALHFPPTSSAMEETEVTRLLDRYGINIVVFGHMHHPKAENFKNPFGELNGAAYHLVSADFVGFSPSETARL